MSTGQFAERCGIHRNTLTRYETGKREPTSGFLDVLAAAGVDVEYVISGLRWSREQITTGALTELLLSLGSRLGVGDDVIVKGLDAVIHEKGRARGAPVPLTTGQVVTDLLAASPLLVVEAGLLAEAIEAVEVSLAKAGRVLAPPAKAKAILALYRATKRSRRVDLHLADELVAMVS